MCLNLIGSLAQSELAFGSLAQSELVSGSQAQSDLALPRSQFDWIALRARNHFRDNIDALYIYDMYIYIYTYM